MAAKKAWGIWSKRACIECRSHWRKVDGAITTAYSVAAHWKHGAHRVKRGRTSPRGRGGHGSFRNGAEGLLLEVRRN
jgi:hypothetical protein